VASLVSLTERYSQEGGENADIIPPCHSETREGIAVKEKEVKEKYLP